MFIAQLVVLLTAGWLAGELMQRLGQPVITVVDIFSQMFEPTHFAMRLAERYCGFALPARRVSRGLSAAGVLVQLGFHAAAGVPWAGD